MTPFDFWTGMWRTGASMAQTGFTMAETLGAAGHVIDSRSRTIANASRSPFTADYAELGRMIPEKIEAFSQGARASVADLQAVQSHMVANWQTLLQASFSGRLPSGKEIETMTRRNASIAEHLSQAGSKALAPVHRAATANAKRLKR
jgi:hypothetical protein